MRGVSTNPVRVYRSKVLPSLTDASLLYRGRPRGGELPIGTRGRASRALGGPFGPQGGEWARFARPTSSLRSLNELASLVRASAGTSWPNNRLNNWLNNCLNFSTSSWLNAG